MKFLLQVLGGLSFAALFWGVMWAGAWAWEQSASLGGPTGFATKMGVLALAFIVLFLGLALILFPGRDQ